MTLLGDCGINIGTEFGHVQTEDNTKSSDIV
jgi:hypothetical protein